jgi:nucleotide-binding universal stress UspA family protein
MLPQIKNILYATDLSENARYAYKYAASLAQQYEARVTILHVIEKPTAETFLQIQGYIGEE